MNLFRKISIYFLLSFLGSVISTDQLFGLDITSFSPISADAGETITINGSGFDATFSNNRVFIGGVEATVTGGSISQLFVKVPQNAFYGKIRVMNTGLIAESPLPFTPTFTYGHPTLNASSFSAAVNTATGTSPERIDVADIDGDGKNDVLISRNSGNLYVYRNISTVGNVFFEQVTFTESFNPFQPLLARDLDGDGLSDLVAFGFNGVNVRRNTSTSGAVSFATGQLFAVTNQEQPGLEVADLDGDGRLDIIAQTTGGVNLFRNTSSAGAISFAAAVNIGNGGLGIAAADLNGDGLPEIVVANGSTVRVLGNSSTVGSFSFSATLNLTGNTISEVELVDLDLDGNIDVVGFAPGNQPVGVQVYKNTTSGTISFAAVQSYSTGAGGSTRGGFHIGDVNGDERPDVVITRGPNSSVAVLLNSSSPGSTSLQVIQSYVTGTSPYDSFVADIDGDNKSDLIATNRSSNNFSVRLNTVPATIPTITSNSVGQTILQPGESTNVNFTLTGVFYYDNNLSVELSDNTGSFASPTVLNTVITDASGSVSFTIPAATPVGNYKVRLVTDRPSLITNELNITVDRFFYSINSGSFNVTTRWNTKSDGSGIAAIASDFTDGNSDFIIQNGHTISAASSAIDIYDLTIEAGGIYLQNANVNVDIRGNTSISGTYQFSTDNTVTYHGTLTIESTGVFEVTAAISAKTHYRGNIINKGTFNVAQSNFWYIDDPLSIQNQSASNMNFSQNVSGLGFISADLDILDFTGGGKINMYSNTPIAVADNVTITNYLGNGTYPTESSFNLIAISATTGVTFKNAGTGKVRYNSPIVSSNVTFDFADTGNEVYYVYGGDHNVVPTTYDNVYFYSGISTTASLVGDITVNGNLTVAASTTLNAGSNNINIAGSWDNNNGTSGFTAGTSTVTFNASGAISQNIFGSTDFYDLVINNTSSSGQVVMANDFTVSNGLTLQSGNIFLSSNSTISLLASSLPISGTFSATRMIRMADETSEVRKYFDAIGSYGFPIGTTSVYTPSVVTLNSGTTFGSTSGTRYVGISCIASEEPNVINTGLSLTKYWTVSSANLSSITGTLDFNYNDAEISGTESNYVSGFYNGTWTSFSGVTATSNLNSFLISGASSLNGNYSAGEPESFGLFVVTNTNDTGAGSLRSAITYANSISGVNSISFDIPVTDTNYSVDMNGNEMWTIYPFTDLPDITQGAILDATTQPGLGNYKIRLDGQNLRSRGLSITGGFAEIYGFYITRFTANSASAGIFVQYLGGSPSTIGGVGKGNVINLNQNGITILNRGNCIVKSNLIGTDETGEIDLGNVSIGIQIGAGGANNQIVGGVLAGEGNLISGNTTGLFANASGAHIIQGNYIGTNLDGTLAISNTDGVVMATNSNNRILGNLISGNTGSAIRLAFTSNNTIQGNTIGESSNGSALGNDRGIEAFNTQAVSNNVIDGNTIANHTNEGILLINALSINNQITTNKMYCNGSGISLSGAANNNIQPPNIISISATTVSGSGTIGDIIHLYIDNSGCTPIQGNEFLNSTTIDGSGNWSISGLTIDINNDNITATTTNATDGTSEFINFSGVPFITTWETTTSNESITIPTTGAGYKYDVDWGDGTVETNLTGNATHNYTSVGIHTVSIFGTFPRIFFNNSGDETKIVSIEQWGDIQWISMNSAFSNCTNLTENANDAPDLSLVTDLSNMFKGATSLNQDLSNWDVSTITNMSNLFDGASTFNQDIDGWDVSNVTDMSRMFFNTNFNKSLNSWIVSNVTSMRDMFASSSFNNDISSWDVSNVNDMSNMFLLTPFNQDISQWNVSGLVYMGSMFSFASQFNQDLSGWDVSNVQIMSAAFRNTSFDQNINAWDVSKVTLMNGLFSNTPFNQPLDNWNTLNVTAMRGMFSQNSLFDQDISGWNVSKVTDLAFMLNGATTFNQSLANWDVSAAGDMTSMLDNSGLSLSNYDATLIGWEALPSLQTGVTLGALGLLYCAGESQRTNLINAPNNWVISGDAKFCAPTITSFTPTSTASGTTVTITGTNFTNVSSVVIGGVTVTSFTVTSLTTIDAIVPLGASSGSISVTTPVGTASATGFTFVPSPEIEVIFVYQNSPVIDGQINPLSLQDSEGNDIACPNEFRINNIGSADLNISTIGFVGTDLVAIPAGTTIIPVGGSLRFCVQPSVTTTQPVTFNDVLTILSDDSDEAQFDFPIAFTYYTPVVNFYSGADNTGLPITDGQLTPIDFGTIVEGNSTSMTFAIVNTGNMAGEISGITVDGIQFSINSTIGIINQGATETFTITLDGSTLGTFDQTVTITRNAGFGFATFSFPVTGVVESANGQQITVEHNGAPLISTQGTIGFGDVTMGEQTTETFTITNSGTNDLVITDIILADGTLFTISGLVFPITLAPGETLDVLISLDATVLGPLSDVLTILSNDPNINGFEINLGGNILPVPTPDIAVEYNSNTAAGVVEFQPVEEGAVVFFDFQILNNGNADLAVTAINSSSNVFSIGSITLPNTIAAGGNTTFNIILSTVNVGIFESTITVESNDPDEGIYTFDVRGIVEGARVVIVITNTDNSTTRLVISNEDVDLGQTNFNVNIEKQFGIENLSDTEEIFVNSITVDNPVFTITNVPTSILAGTWAGFTITLNSKSVGMNNARVTVSTSLNDFSFGVVAEVLTEGDPPLSIYNVVTPNGDGVHDYFKIENITSYPDNKVIIFNRWGDKIFEMSGYNNTDLLFEGISNTGSNKEIDTGSYYYSIDKGNGSKVMTGYLFIKR